jgi:hypothetical protein
MSPKEFYASQLADQQSRLSALQKQIKQLSSFRLIVGIIILVVGYLILSEKLDQWWVILLCIAGFLIVVRRHNKLQEQEEIAGLHIRLLENELSALEGDYSPFKDGGEFIDSKHPYSFDLDFFGKRSIYQLLCRAATKNGELALAELLKQPYADPAEVRKRQEVIEELALFPEFLINFRVAGAAYQEGEKDTEKISAWLGMQDNFLNSALIRVLVILIPVLTVVAAVLSILFDGFYPLLLLIVCFNWLFLRYKAQAIKEASYYVARSAKLIEKYEALTGVVAGQEFNAAGWQDDAAGALLSMQKLKKLAHLFESRYNGMVGPLMNSLFMFDIQCGVLLERWRRDNKNKISKALTDITEVDTYICLSTFACNHPQYNYPAFTIGSNTYSAANFAHPLLEKTAVGNSFSLGAQEQFYLLTGANMTGKSTFIRTLGVNIILAYTGVPLRGDHINIPLTRLYTAMRITDSVQDDVSYFRAELMRIQEIMREVQHSDQPYLILLDEPLRGTNTTDKQNGTRSIIEKFIRLNAIGIVATHDTVLCNLEQVHDGRVANYHFESSIEGNELRFDYQLKKGCSTSNNATILMQQMGIV